MASYQQNGNGTEDRKISGFSKQPHTVQSRDQATSDNGKKAKGDSRAMVVQRSRRFWVSLLVDLLLLAILAGLVAGGIFGYRALRNLYAPEWETREVVFQVKMDGIEPDMVKYGQDGRPTIAGNPIWSSDRTDADQLGTVVDVRTVLVSTEDGTNTLTLYLTVEATAYYREGKGYRMGETMLLAGSESTFRLKGITAKGQIISMHEKQDELTNVPEADTTADQSENVPPQAQG